MKRILIIGNSGSGKSWLAARLAEELTIREVNLDTIVWQPGGFNQNGPNMKSTMPFKHLLKSPHGWSKGYLVPWPNNCLMPPILCYFWISTGLHAVIH